LASDAMGIGIGKLTCGRGLIDDEEAKPRTDARSSIASSPSKLVCSSIGRGVLSSPVILHIYNLGRTATLQATNGVLRALGSGVFHCGVEVYQREWSYEDTGVFCVEPKQCEDHSYQESLPMGNAWLSESDVIRLVDRLEEENWLGGHYDTLKHNCCHFCNELCKELGVGEIPERFQDVARKVAAVCDVLDSWRSGVYTAESGDSLLCCCAQNAATLRNEAVKDASRIQPEHRLNVHSRPLHADMPSEQDEMDIIPVVWAHSPPVDGLVHLRESEHARGPLHVFYRETTKDSDN